MELVSKLLFGVIIALTFTLTLAMLFVCGYTLVYRAGLQPRARPRLRRGG